MEIHLIKTPLGLKPIYDFDEEKYGLIKNGEIIKAKITKARNIKFHGLFWSLIELVFVNQKKYKTKEDLLIEVKLKTGCYNEHITLEGEIKFIPKSISFEKMDDLEFRDFYNKTLNILGELLNVDSEKLRLEVERYYT